MREADPAVWDQAIARTGSLVLHTERRRGAMFILLAVVMTAASLFAALAASRLVVTIAGWAGLVFFGVLGIPVLTWSTVGGRPVTVVDAQGVAVSSRRLAWHDIAEIVVFTTSGTAMVAVVPTERGADNLASQSSLWTQLTDHANRMMLGTSALFLPTLQGVAPEPFCAWLNRVLSQRTHGA